MARVHIPVFPSPGSRPVPSVEVRHSLRSQTEAISPLVDQLISLIRASRTADGSEDDIEIALREAVTNAVVHGNREDQNKHVEIICRLAIDGAVDITIRDEGDGFDSSSIPDPTAPENRMSTHGRGIYLMRSLMDEVRFEDRGTVVHLYKKPNAKAA